jgi:hypothetical protein
MKVNCVWHDEALNYRKRAPMTREYRWYANIADIEFRQLLDITALLRRTQVWMEQREDKASAAFMEKFINTWTVR